MNAEQWARLRTIFHDAVDQPPDRRHAWLVDACGGNAELLREAESLLAAHDTVGGFLDQPAAIEPDAADALPPGSRIGPHYEIHDVLGRGGMGIVYLAHDSRLGRRVALKALPASVAASPELRERLRREARAAATISHRAVATVYALEEIDGELYIATEYVPGHTLASEIGKGPVPAGRAVAIAREIAGALAAAHEAGIVHRDLKPDNVLLDGDAVKVVDFGIAHIEGPEATRLTRAGALLGTPAYMAPEQLLGGSVDARADIYAAGVILSEMLTGRHPLRGAGSVAVPPPFVAIINRCLQTDPGSRYGSARELLTALESAGTSDPVSGVPPGRPKPAPTTDARWWWAFHQIAAVTVYCAMVYPAWLGRGVLAGRIGRAFFIAILTSVIVSVTLRMHLWFTLRSYPDELAWTRRRNGRWIHACDLLFSFALIAGGLAIGDTPLGITFIAVGIGAGAASIIVEPVTTRAAFGAPSGDDASRPS